VVWEWHAWNDLVQDLDPERAKHGDVTAHHELIDVNGDHRREPPMTAAERQRPAEVEAQMRALGYAGDDEEEEQEEEDQGGRGRRRGGDWLHTNSVALQPELDLILLSVPNFSELWVIDHSTSTEEAKGHSGGRWGRGGDLLYRWGNPKHYAQGTRKDQQLFRQHDATWLAGSGGELSLLVFNNGGGRRGGDRSTVDEIALPFEPGSGFQRAAEAAFDPSQPEWSYPSQDQQSFYSSFISGAQRLPNGNTLVCSGVHGRLFEVTRAGEVVWDYLNPFGGEAPGSASPPRGGERPGAGGPPGGRPGGPPGGRPGDRSGGPPPDGPPKARRGGGGGGPDPIALFRGTRIPADHPAFVNRF